MVESAKADQPDSLGLRSRPTTLCAAASMGLLLLAIGVLALTGLVPRADFSFRPNADLSQVLLDGRTIDGDATVELTAPGHQPVALRASQLADYWEPRGSRLEREQVFAARDRIAALISQPGTILRLPDGSVRPVSASHGFTFPSINQIVMVLSGLVAGLIGLWLVILRPAERPARAVALCSVLFYTNMFVLVAMSAVNPATSGTTTALLLQANYGVCIGMAVALIHLFARFPTPLVRTAWLNLLWPLATAIWLGLWLGSVDRLYLWYDTCIWILALGIIALLIWQARKSRGRPDNMAIIRWIGSTLLLAIVVVFWFAFLPQLVGHATIDLNAFVVPVFTLFFLALGIASTRYRLFDLGNWSTQIARTSLILMVVLVLDVCVAVIAGTTWTLSAALVSAALIWIPLRERALRRVERSRGLENIALLRHANSVAFARGSADKEKAWRAFLQAQFDPLTLEPVLCDAVAIHDNGQSLRIPSPLGHGANELAFAGNGTRLFGPADVTVAKAMISLVGEVIEARNAYDRGVVMERSRIARDLHDDVGARLMTSLYHEDLGAMQADVRLAISEMRMIIDGLSGCERSLEESFADLRHETISRLSLAGIDAHWPLPDLAGAPDAIDHRAHQALHSVARELFSNVLRHADAKTVRVSVAIDEAALRFRVHDDGRGVAGKRLIGGNGLANMRRRLTELGGRLDIEPVERGSSFLATIPLASLEQGMA